MGDLKKGFIFLFVLLLAIGGGTYYFFINTPEEALDEKTVRTEVKETVEKRVPTDEDLDAVIEYYSHIVDGIQHTFAEAATKYNFMDGFERSEAGAFAEELGAYATDKMINKQLFETAETYCFGGCDMMIVPYADYTVRENLIEYTEDKIVLEFLQPLDEIGNGGFKAQIVLVREDYDNWKLDSFECEQVNFKLTPEEATQVANQYEQAYTLVNELTVDGRKLYAFERDDYPNMIGIFADTGQWMFDSSQLSGN